MISYIIVDDEPIAHRIIEDYAKTLGNLQLKSNCYDALQALTFLGEHSVDLIFLDLNMPKLKGFDFLKTLKNAPHIIVTTAYSEYALEGFDLNVLDYLLKPFSFNRFIQAVNKLSITEQPKIISFVENKPSNSDEFIMLKGEKKHYRIKLSDIFYIEADRNYSKVFLQNKSILINKTISSFEKHIIPEFFIRVHKSFIVNTHYIDLIEKNEIKLNHYLVAIGQSYKESIKKYLDL